MMHNQCLEREKKTGYGYANPKNTIIKFVNHRFCYQALDKKMELHKLDSKRWVLTQ